MGPQKAVERFAKDDPFGDPLHRSQLHIEQIDRPDTRVESRLGGYG